MHITADTGVHCKFRVDHLQVKTLRIEDVVRPALSPSSSSTDEVLSPENEIFFMKMDIELSEPYALLGMQSLLLEGRVRHIAIEAFTPLLLPM